MRKLNPRRPSREIRDLLKGLEHAVSVGKLPSAQDENRLRLALVAYHGHKCAFSEHSERDIVLHRFRPAADATSGVEVSREHYAWLRFTWRNLCLATPAVHTTKGTQFPVLDHERARPGGRLSRERPLLLDPYVDDPLFHLRFDQNGDVRSVPHPHPDIRRACSDVDRGAFTISICGLNAQWLVRQRSDRFRDDLSRFQVLFESSVPPDKADPLFSSCDPFHGGTRQVLARRLLELALETRFKSLPAEQRAWIDWLEAEIGSCLLDEGAERALEVLGKIRPGHRGYEYGLFTGAIRRARQRAGLPEAKRGNTLAEIRATTAVWGAHVLPNSVLKGVKIRNFKAIRSLDLRFDPLPDLANASEGVQWAALIGDNGAGKSTILEAIALACQAARAAVENAEVASLPEYGSFEWSDCLSRARRPRENAEARITLEFSGTSITVNLSAEGPECSETPRQFDLFVRGYGASRAISEYSSDSRLREQTVRVDGLITRRGAVVDPQAWLRDLHSSGHDGFRVVAESLENFLGDAGLGETAVAVKNDRLLVGGVPIEHQSSGIRSIFTMLADIVAGQAERFSDLKNATGLVLIDEIGEHLHPRWRLLITQQLRDTFPKVQFVVSTHEPLCLRGLRQGEAHLVERSAHGVSSRTIKLSPSSMKLDQLLTSEFFGLRTTMDPETERLFRKYYAELAADRSTPRPSGLPQHLLGTTRRDQLFYGLVDRYLASEKMRSSKARSDTADSIVDELWRSAQREIELD